MKLILIFAEINDQAKHMALLNGLQTWRYVQTDDDLRSYEGSSTVLWLCGTYWRKPNYDLVIRMAKQRMIPILRVEEN